MKPRCEKCGTKLSQEEIKTCEENVSLVLPRYVCDGCWTDELRWENNIEQEFSDADPGL